MSIEVTGTDGQLPSGRIAIVASRYNPAICNALVSGAIETLAAAGYDDAATPILRVPGAWELPAVVKQVLGQPNMIAAIALGCVIQGETTHDQHINRAVSAALMEIGVDRGIPVAFGLLTCNTLEQAIQRSGGAVGNKGNEAAEAVLELLRLGKKIESL